jgi:hypothetical protein
MQIRMMWSHLQYTQTDPQTSLSFYLTNSKNSGFVEKVPKSLLLAIPLEECHVVDSRMPDV